VSGSVRVSQLRKAAVTMLDTVLCRVVASVIVKKIPGDGFGFGIVPACLYQTDRQRQFPYWRELPLRNALHK